MSLSDFIRDYCDAVEEQKKEIEQLKQQQKGGGYYG
jgi:hypothetical protein